MSTQLDHPNPTPDQVRCRWRADAVAYLDETTADGRRLLSGAVWTYRLPAPLTYRRMSIGLVEDVQRARHPALPLWVLQARGSLLYGVHPRVVELMRDGVLHAELALGPAASYVAGTEGVQVFTRAEVVAVVASLRASPWPGLPPLTFALEEACP